MRTGIFGGSFNPPHLGHMHLAESVRDALSLDEVLLVPSKISPHRSMAEYAPEQDRLEMCRLAAEQYPWMRAEDFELRQEGVSYTYYTVRHFAEMRPEDTLWLLMGSDMLLSFHKWYRWQDILQYAGLAAIAREAGEYDALTECARDLQQYGKVSVINVESFAVSSTKIRELVKNSQDYSCYLPGNIVQYIRMQKLYEV